MVPLGRWGEPEDVAKAVAFLASDAAAYVNGQTLAVCGAWCGDLKRKTKTENDNGTLRTKSKTIIVRTVGREQGSGRSGSLLIEDLGADSLDTVELVMAFEEEFGPRFR
jgi:acyl carrier protein